MRRIFGGYLIKSIIFIILILQFHGTVDILAYDSRDEWERKTRFDSGIINNLRKVVEIVSKCFIEQTIFAGIDLNNNCIPNGIGNNIDQEYNPTEKTSFLDYRNNYCANKANIGSILNFDDAPATESLIIGAVTAGIALLTFVPLAGPVALAGVIGYQIGMMIDACVNSYIEAPHDYINYNAKNLCNGKNCITDWTKEDIPYFFQCDNKNEYGYMGDLYCALDSTREYPISGMITKDMIGQITIKRVNIWKRLFNKYDYKNKTESDGTIVFSRNEIKMGTKKDLEGGPLTIPMSIRNYYRFFGGKVQLCAAVTNTFLPFVIGCTYIPHPIEKKSFGVDENKFKDLIKDTRCSYFLEGERSDLKTLGMSLYKSTQIGKSHSASSLFLMSDMHIISTTVGCIQDLVTVSFINPSHPEGSFFRDVQNGMKSIVIAVLILYIGILGFNIISSGNSPQTGEIVMYIIRFVIVLYLGLGNVWYNPQNQGDNQRIGLYTGIISGIERLASVFVNAADNIDPIGMCKISDSNQRNVFLSGNGIDIGNAKTNSIYNTKGNIMLTLWDYIDCKVINYLNFNSCQYYPNVFALLVFIIAGILGAIFQYGFSSLLIAVMALIQVITIFSTVFKFVHTVILSIFIITVLVLIAPIMVCFILFDYTRGFFKKWLDLLLSYSLYPAIIFICLAFVFATFDSVLYSDISTAKRIIKEKCNTGDGCEVTVQEMCNVKGGKIKDSPYCKVLNIIAKENGDIPTPINGCNVTTGKILSAFIEEIEIPIIFTFPVIRGEVIPVLLSVFVKLGIISLILMICTEMMINMIAGIVHVDDITNIVRGGGVLGYSFGAASKIATANTKATFMGMKMIGRKLLNSDSSSENKDEKDEEKKNRKKEK